MSKSPQIERNAAYVHRDQDQEIWHVALVGDKAFDTARRLKLINKRLKLPTKEDAEIIAGAINQSLRQQGFYQE